MQPDPYADPFADEPAPEPAAARPRRRADRPYGVQPIPPGLVRAPGTPMDSGTSAPPNPSSFAAGAATEDKPAPRSATEAASAFAAPTSASADCRSQGQRPAAPSSAPATKPPRPRRAPDPAKPLPGRREAFCQAFVVCGNASRAAMQAGYSVPAAGNQGYRLLRRPEVKARIAAIHRELGGDSNRDADVLLGKLEAVYRRAVDGGYLNAAARIVELQARMAGRLALRPSRKDEK